MNENESAVAELLDAVENVAPVEGEQDVQQDVQTDATASGGVTSYEVAPEAVALLSDIAQTLESSSSQYLYSMDSSQAQYFAGILSSHPFDQYVSWYDEGGYYLYYGRIISIRPNKGIILIVKRTNKRAGILVKSNTRIAQI